MKKRENEESAAQSAIILAGVVIVVAVLAVLFGLQTLVWINAKHWASVDAWLNDTPQPLPALANAVPLPPAPLDKKGNQLHLPNCAHTITNLVRLGRETRRPCPQIPSCSSDSIRGK